MLAQWCAREDTIVDERQAGWYAVHGANGSEVYWDGTGWAASRSVFPNASGSAKPAADPATWYPDKRQPGGERHVDGNSETDRRRGAVLATRVKAPFEPNPMGLAVAAFGAVLAVVAIFLPQLESPGLVGIKDNTLVANGDGWLVLGLAVGSAAGAYAAYRNKNRRVAPLILGAVLIGLAIYDGTGARLDLHSTAPASSILHFNGSVKASPGVGLYMVGVGGAAVLLGGLMLAGVGSYAQAPTRGGTKKCPDCAETILVDARVCKHCGRRLS